MLFEIQRSIKEITKTNSIDHSPTKQNPILSPSVLANMCKGTVTPAQIITSCTEFYFIL